MAEHGLERLERRVAQLERAAGRWRVAALTLTGVVSVAALLGATTTPSAVPDDLRARRFTLVDETGQELGWMGAGRNPENGALMAHVSLYGRQGSSVVLNPSAGLIVGSGSGQAVVNDFGVTIGGPGLVAHFGRTTHASPVLTLSGREPQVLLMDEERRTRAVLGVMTPVTIGTHVTGPRSPSSLVLMDKDGKLLFEAP